MVWSTYLRCLYNRADIHWSLLIRLTVIIIGNQPASFSRVPLCFTQGGNTGVRQFPNILQFEHHAGLSPESMSSIAVDYSQEIYPVHFKYLVTNLYWKQD